MNAQDKAYEKARAQERKRKEQQAARVDKMQRGEILTASETVKYIEYFPVNDRACEAYRCMNKMHLATAALYVTYYK